MRILTIVLALIGLNLSFSQNCPPPSIISPCECQDRIGDDPPFINCYKIREEFNLKGVFDNVSSFLGNNTLFHSLSIYETPIHKIEDGTFENFKFNEIYILHNFNLTYISPRAFNASRHFTECLTVQDNGVKNDSNIFEFVGIFHELEYLNIGYDQITTVPSNAFGRNPSLRELILQHNQIGNRIGSHAFDTGSIKLRVVELWNNTIPSEGLPNDAFAGIPDSVEFSLTCNDLEFLEERSFRILLDLAGKVIVVGESRRCFDGGNPEGGFYCDERINWICNDEGRYAPKLTGYSCKVGSGFTDIWEYCASRNGTVNL